MVESVSQMPSVKIIVQKNFFGLFDYEIFVVGAIPEAAQGIDGSDRILLASNHFQFQFLMVLKPFFMEVTAKKTRKHREKDFYAVCMEPLDQLPQLEFAPGWILAFGARIPEIHICADVRGKLSIFAHAVVLMQEVAPP
ncbi:MAG: hypothetical protein IJJ33_10020 [Victivallales bacterium]|nr:hypothetical protein [Victivallales bacterium]